MAEREYILFCDESDRRGKFYSNFYGGLLVGASKYQAVTSRLNAVKQKLNLHGEVKWSKVTKNYLSKYEALVEAFFNEISSGSVKVRIMFCQNARKPVGLTDEQLALTYWLLYYQFVKHAFGFAMMPPSEEETHLRLYFDQFPDTGEQAAQFKGFIHALEKSQEFDAVKLQIRREDITEVDSHDHVLLQCLDILLGAMTFRLNDKHLEKPADSRRRGSRTIAKEKLYKKINGLIRALYPHFNIGITTGGGPAGRWEQPYRHWLFVANKSEYDDKETKGWQKKNPA